MNKPALTTRFLLFTVFFLAGLSAIVLSILAHPELYSYYHNRAALDELGAQNQKIEELTAQYTARIELIESEPNILSRFSATTFGQKPTAPDTAFPGVGNETLRAETEKLLKAEAPPEPADPIPNWLNRIMEPTMRIALFLAGTALILITFIFFGSTHPKDAA